MSNSDSERLGGYAPRQIPILAIIDSVRLELAQEAELRKQHLAEFEFQINKPLSLDEQLDGLLANEENPAYRAVATHLASLEEPTHIGAVTREFFGGSLPADEYETLLYVVGALDEHELIASNAGHIVPFDYPVRKPGVKYLDFPEKDQPFSVSDDFGARISDIYHSTDRRVFHLAELVKRLYGRLSLHHDHYQDFKTALVDAGLTKLGNGLYRIERGALPKKAEAAPPNPEPEPEPPKMSLDEMLKAANVKDSQRSFQRRK
jgi:hypothetical protein